MRRVTIEFPDEALAALGAGPEELADEMRLAAAVIWYEQRRISQERAAEIAGLSRVTFIDALARFGVSPIQYDPGELADEISDGA